ncbi:hypothetical protein Tco_0798200 [Tanacetum coccineum]
MCPQGRTQKTGNRIRKLKLLLLYQKIDTPYSINWIRRINLVTGGRIEFVENAVLSGRTGYVVKTAAIDTLSGDHIRGPYANVNTTYDRYLDSRNGRAGNNSDVQEEEEQHNKGQCDLFDNPTQKLASLQDMDQDSAHMVAASKVPMLKPGEYEIWRMRIEQYIQMIDYALWEVIENGATLPKTTTVEGF